MTKYNKIVNDYDEYNKLLNRESIKENIESILNHFDEICQYNTSKKGIYIHGHPGTGKTTFVLQLLKRLNYDVILYNAGDVRNKSLFQTIDSNHISNRNVLDLMCNRVRKIAIVMDEIDGMNNGDKGGIDALIKLIRQKKTKKQKCENTTLNPIICIGNHENDKKIRELMKASHVFELPLPTVQQIHDLLLHVLPPYNTFDRDFQVQIIDYIQGDLRKFDFLVQLWKKRPTLITPSVLKNIFHLKTSNEDAKKITWKLLSKPVPLKDHNIFMNETDRTTVALLWHENIAHLLSQHPMHKVFPFYCKLLSNMCYADYIGRITFQSQIWQFNEMTSLIKTFYNNQMFHIEFPKTPKPIQLSEIDFTKVLTKYSTEYNNQLFLQSLCQRMTMDKKDLVSFFHELRVLLGEYFYLNQEKLTYTETILQKDEIDALDIKRMYRFLDKNVKKEDIIDTVDADGDNDSFCE
jgi:hypothetical protein